MAADSAHYLVKNTRRGEIFWEISLLGKETVVRSGAVGACGKAFAARRHRSEADARRHVTHQVTNKKKQGFQFPSETEERGRVRDDEYDADGDARLDSPGSSRNTGKRRREEDECEGPSEKKRTYEDELRRAAIRANQLKGRRPGDGGTDTGHDTDSIASSTSDTRGRAKPGVSPLNRRRSRRLAAKNMEVGLSSQQTVEMTSSRALERMETSTRWSHWRGERASSTIPSKRLRRGQSTLQRMDTLPSDEVTATVQPGLLTRRSTTRSLRQQMANTDLAGPTAAPSTQGKLSSGLTTILAKRPTMTELGRARGEDWVPSSGQGPKLKRQRSKGAEATDLEQKSKRQKVERQVKQVDRQKAGVQRQQSLTPGTGSVFKPPPNLRPLRLTAPVVWRVALDGVTTVDGVASSRHGLGVCVTPTRCLVGDESGRVLELNENVRPVRRLALPSGVKCLVEDGDFMYAGCNDGAVYDITQGSPRMVYRPQGFGQLFSLDIYQGILAVSDRGGRVAVFNHHGDVVWQKQSDGEFGWMVRLDNTGVYHGHSTGVTKYSLTEGRQVWKRTLRDGVLAGVRSASCLYVSSGSAVVKLDQLTGKILRTFNKGKTQSRIVHTCAVGAGLVYAGGHKIVCYDEVTGDVIYILSPAEQPASMQYFDGRLFCVGNGAMAVIDLTEHTIQKAMAGEPIESVEVTSTSDPDIETTWPLQKVPTVPLAATSGTQSGVLVEVYQPEPRQSRLLVRTLSQGFYKNWDVQLPADICTQEGRRFVVPALKPSETGQFYRVLGDIQEAVSPSGEEF